MPGCIVERLQAEDISEVSPASLGEELKELFGTAMPATPRSSAGYIASTRRRPTPPTDP
jgi:hypothetical protein